MAKRSRFQERTRPVPGNHEYGTDDADGYFSYWGRRAGKKGEGYYSFDLEKWHLVALNSNLRGKSFRQQGKWLADDLAANKQRCILAFWHHPLFSSANHGNNSKMRKITKTLFSHGTSVILAGHDHVYERFDPQTPNGKPDLKRGIRMFNVGTGGATLYKFTEPRPNSRHRYRGDHGV